MGNGFPEIYAQLEEGGLSATYEVTLTWVYVYSAIYETYLVQWFSRDLCLIGGGGASPSATYEITLTWPYVHSPIYGTYLV